MNERIKQLKEQAMSWVPNMADPDTKIRLLNAEKFAELIVQDIHAYDDSLDTAQIISRGILRRYGMEEK
jgi:hypothetical protein